MDNELEEQEEGLMLHGLFIDAGRWNMDTMLLDDPVVGVPGHRELGRLETIINRYMIELLSLKIIKHCTNTPDGIFPESLFYIGSRICRPIS